MNSVEICGVLCGFLRVQIVCGIFLAEASCLFKVRGPAPRAALRLHWAPGL